ncbi:CbiX/SirB N-terminal domain-containing protein [Spongiactinospora sp. TRM90649]|uniref:sirohydrochlorin chelatase n=1 Tax=Spongiactinospora sp. TRM90649 TaxID=3031114 RepID=UPI0023F969EE|nr:CbiX/SirB N-terminal domain-containing protein [Spongiactinospora sp. TRM90649]MDF5752278.1 CbiX/SirB N-terminal domain-containing protein [Spongiactinospora sp. TRM90649]
MNQSPERLPIRERSPRPVTGRHRRPVPAQLPPNAPAFVLAVPGSGDEVSAEVASALIVENPHVDVRVAHLEDGAECVAKQLAELADERPEGATAAVVVPLVTGPYPRVFRIIREAVAQSGVHVIITDPLGPHPMLAEALHVRLADKGLARADRMRLFNIGAPMDGVIVATAGGDEAARAAETTAVLLAARLAVPVVAAAIDASPSIGDAAERLHRIGASKLAIAPYVIGPEGDLGKVATAAEAIGAGFSEAIGAHSAVVQLAASNYGGCLEES